MEQTKEKVFTKKYTNADFYVDGKFNGEVSLKAYLEMFEFYGVPFTDFMKENMWISDFGLGDFEHAGMAGVFWVNDPVNRHFGHEIYLLPGQMIPDTVMWQPLSIRLNSNHGWYATDRLIISGSVILPPILRHCLKVRKRLLPSPTSLI